MIVKVRAGSTKKTNQIQNEINHQIELAKANGYKVNEALTTTHVSGEVITYSIFFEELKAKQQKREPSPRQANKIRDPSVTEKLLMACFSTKFLTANERERISESEITIDDAKNLKELYEGTRKLDRDELNKMGLKTTFQIFVNNLRDQSTIAKNYVEKHKKQSPAPREEPIKEPAFDWRSIGVEMFGEETFLGITWRDVPDYAKKDIIKKANEPIRN